MFGTLLESRARRQRRRGGAAVSVALHVAIIGAITATTVHGRIVAKDKPESVIVHFNHPPAPPVPASHATTRDLEPGPVIMAPVPIRRIDPPTTTPISLPPIDSSFGRGTDSIVIGRGSSSPGLARSIVDGDGQEATREWVGADLQTRIVASARPRYPESLRQAAIDGRVLVRFVVDTTGRIDMSSVAMVSTTHELFSRAVRDALPGFRFKPAEVGGHHVRALAEMPFEFQIMK